MLGLEIQQTRNSTARCFNIFKKQYIVTCVVHKWEINAGHEGRKEKSQGPVLRETL